MKKILNIGLVGLVGFIFSGCSTKTIWIDKLDNGSVKYTLHYKVKPDIITKKYKGFNIHNYYIDFESINNDNKVKVKLVHDISFTQGTGVPSDRYTKAYLFDHLKDFYLSNLKTNFQPTVFSKKHVIFQGYSEIVLKTYPKQEFINKVLNNKVTYINIKTQKGYLTLFETVADSPVKIKLKGIDKLKKFALCLKDEKYCKDEKK